LPEINDVVVRLSDFPFNGFTIVQLTDLHIGRTLKRDFVEKVIARTNALNPDMVVITGDLFDLPPEKISDDLEPLKTLEAPVYFVTGNHEYFHGIAPILEKVKSLGIKPLTNESIIFGNSKDSFNLVGLNDLTGERFGIEQPDADTAYEGLDESKPTIVLSHQPKSISLVEGRRCDLMLSGHTHGGQIFPFGVLVMLDQPYLEGLHEFTSGKQIFISRGAGYWGPPLRVLAPSEISRIVITKT
jgi:predicted MPP superfamily phosphohydrolase